MSMEIYYRQFENNIFLLEDQMGYADYFDI